MVRGRKYIYYGDIRHEIGQGHLFYLSAGCHYTEEVPENGEAFEQISVYCTPGQLSHVLNLLSVHYRFQPENSHCCDSCSGTKHVVCPEWDAVRHFYTDIGQYLREDIFHRDKTVGLLKMTELIYLILTREDCCLKNRILETIDSDKDNFEQIIQRNVFNDLSIEELARLCNRSPTSFKKEFKRCFYEPPHKWFIRQRLMHARLLLVSTGKPVTEIGNECNFSNTSHFIKLFRKEYGMTPANYRSRHIGRHAADLAKRHDPVRQKMSV